MAPQWLWPQTTMSFTSSTTVANSMPAETPW